MLVDGLVEIFRPCSKSQRKKIDPLASFLETKSSFDEAKLRSSADLFQRSVRNKMTAKRAFLQHPKILLFLDCDVFSILGFCIKS